MSCLQGNFVDIAAGYAHSLALLKDGRVTGWGAGSTSEINGGTNGGLEWGQVNIPAAIENNATGIAAGALHSLALLKNGNLVGWGNNNSGQINIPVGIGNNSTVIAAGWYHSLALLKDGRVTGWGDNEFGQTTIPVGIGNNATGIAAGRGHSLALLKDGRVTGWGYNSNNEITVPVGIGTNAAGIAAGYAHSLALLKDGRVTGWGVNQYGQTTIPVGIGNNAVEIAAGYDYSLALLKDGRVTGWGYNGFGQATIPAGIGTNATGITAGYRHSFALLKDGRVTGWGWEVFNSLLLNVPKCSQTITFPSIPTKTFGDAPFVLTATASSNLAVSYTSSNTSVATVAGNVVTIVGVGTTTITASQAGDSNYNAATPVSQTLTVNKGSQIITFPTIPIKYTTDASFNVNATSTNNTIPITYASSNTSVATISSNGTITLVGPGTSTIIASQAGNDFYTSTSVTRELIVIQLSSENFCNKISEISTKGWHSLALLKNGSVFAWGSTKLEQLADANNQGNLSPGTLDYNRNVLNVPLEIIQAVTGISASYTYNLALLKDGRVTGWGSNQYGQLNIPSNIQYNTTNISAGSGHALALLKNGSVTGWGSNTYGQINVPVGIGNNATGIVAGGFHSLALLKNGSVSGWGSNSYGLLNVPASIQGNVTGIKAGMFHNLALLKNGNINGWGGNSFGEINIPTSVQGDATGIDAGLNYSLALLKNGQIVGWGKNAQNQIIIPASLQFNGTGVYAGAEHALSVLKDGKISGWGNNFSQIPSTVSCGETFENYTGYANIYVLFESNVSNRQPNNTAQPCPRINVFLEPFVPADITEPGFYKFNFFLNGTTNKRCGIDTIAWNYIGGVGVKESQDIEIESCPDFPIINSRAGEFNDQIRKQINIVWPGNYYFRIKIT